MNKKAISLIAATTLALGLMAGCGESTVTQTTDVSGTNVTVEEVVKRDIVTTATYTGTLTATNSAAVTSKVSAKITSINVEVGDWVEKGQVLAVLDSSDYRYQLSQAEASYKQAEAGYNSAVTSLNNVGGSTQQSRVQLEQALNSAKIAYDNAKTNFDRQAKLYEMGAISLAAYESAQSGLENARLAYETAQKSYDITVNVITPGTEDSAKNGVETAAAAKNAAALAVNQAKESVANCSITAPISGYVSANNATLGSFASAGMTLFAISDSRELEAEINATESVIPYVSAGGKALVDIPSANLYGAEGVVTVVNPVKNAMTGMYTVRVSVPNESDNLKVGMFADITLLTQQSQSEALSVLSTSVLQETDGYYVYKVTGNEAEKIQVVIGVTDGTYTQIIEGIEEGDVIVADGKEYISEKNNIVNIIE